MSILIENPKVSPEDYLAGEELSEYKHEYEDGQIIAKVGASRNHNTIQINLTLAIGIQLHPPCRVYSSDMKVRYRNTFYYPDLSVGCEKEQHDQYMAHPLLVVVEVFLPSSEKRDRSIKLLTYQKIPSLQEILLLSQDRMLAECYRRQGDGWTLERYEGPETVELQSVGLTIEMERIYNGVEFKDERTTS